ncbi:twin-arginine translocase TatA/TatE family subunit [Magnetospirillum fulvum]|uniref:Sec-independent protein translocase protein TatA n=1 Tax=Magnetospirillum fulvum MGU-K5 TaxID=1316936 RepID=S9SB42_MAGFU|nr:twin-arginine translocase TatA/TatE family subunit [Magnetospirillum fulvum]EPY01308.1 twin arginine translocase protein A [Magnetospirillum fulvum MGU-K5]
MGSWSIGHWLIVLVIVLLLFGANKIPKLMGDMAKGVKAFKQGLKDGDEEVTAAPQPAPQQPQASVQAPSAAAPTAAPQAAPQPDPLRKS